MVTLALAEVSSRTCELRIVSAGHPPAFVISPEGELREALFASLPLGHSWSSPPEVLTLPFPPGCRLVLYSDGLVEATDSTGEPYGYERLKNELLVHGSLDADRLLSQLLGSLRDYVGSDSLDDDLTVVVVAHRSKPVGGDPLPQERHVVGAQGMVPGDE